MILDTVLATIRRHAMLEPGDRVIVALSGGPDSVALLHILLELGDRLPLAIVAAHLDHGLRGDEAGEDAGFCAALAERLGLSFVAGQADVAALARREKRSLEEAGRHARRRFLREAAGQTGARRVALGHHRDDQAESVLLRLIEGSGRGGLAGIRPVADQLFVRPLLDCAREELLEYLRAREIPFRTDATNEDVRFPRNRLRHRVLPLLREEFNPRVVEAIARTAGLLREEDALLDRMARRALKKILILEPKEALGSGEGTGAAPALSFTTPAPPPGRTLGAPGAVRTVAGPGEPEGAHGRKPDEVRGADLGHDTGGASSRSAVALDAARLAGLAPPIGRRAVRLALRRAGLQRRDLSGARIEEVLTLAAGRVHASLSLGEAFMARYEYGRLLIEPGAAPPQARTRAARREEEVQPRAAAPGGRPADSAQRLGATPQKSTTVAGGSPPCLPGVEEAASAAGTGASGTGTVTSAAGTGASATFAGAPSRDEAGAGAERLLPLPGGVLFPALGHAIRARVVPRAEVESEFRRAPAARAYLDAGKLAAPLLVRRPLPGDRFRPLGAPGSRKLSDLWTDLKVPRRQRERTLVVESSGRIAWAAGLRVAHDFRITARTRTVAVLELAPIEAAVEIPSQTTGGQAGAAGNSTASQRGAVITHERMPTAPLPSAPDGSSLTHAEVEGPPPSESRPPSQHQAGQRPASSTPSLVFALSGPEAPVSVLYSADEISAAVARLAADVAAWAAGREILVLGILHGSFIFVADLVRRLPGPCRIGFLDRDGHPVFRPGTIEGALVLVAEDILDTGESLTRVLEKLRAHGPAEVRTCVLFDKPSGRKIQVTPDWAGLLVPDRWVVGYGLDQEGLFRNLPYLTFV